LSEARLTPAPGLIEEIEIRNLRTHGNQHRDGGRLLQTGVDGSSRHDFELVEPRAAALHRQAKLDAIAGRDLHAARAALRSNGIAIASM
jgi:hypothetical protein